MHRDIWLLDPVRLHKFVERLLRFGKGRGKGILLPVNVQHALDSGTVHRSLLAHAERIGPLFHRLIRDLLEVHAYLNLRRAQGLVAVAQEASSTHYVEQAARFIAENSLKATPRDLRHLLDRLVSQEAAERALPPLSDATREFVRDASYFIHGEGGAA